MDPRNQTFLLELSRETALASLTSTPLPVIESGEFDSEPYSGVFVTFRNHGRLRGCIGRFAVDGSLARMVSRVTLSSLEDPRFISYPVTAEELLDISIEISVLSAMRLTDDPPALIPGIHGVYIARGGSSGCFLPQVATEHGWDAEELLRRCCEYKAGLPPDAWKQPGTEVKLFTAEVFSETC